MASCRGERNAAADFSDAYDTERARARNSWSSLERTFGINENIGDILDVTYPRSRLPLATARTSLDHSKSRAARHEGPIPSMGTNDHDAFLLLALLRYSRLRLATSSGVTRPVLPPKCPIT